MSEQDARAKRAEAWWRNAERPKRAKTPHAAAVAYAAKGWVGPNGEKFDTREQWHNAISH